MPDAKRTRSQRHLPPTAPCWSNQSKRSAPPKLRWVHSLSTPPLEQQQACCRSPWPSKGCLQTPYGGCRKCPLAPNLAHRTLALWPFLTRLSSASPHGLPGCHQAHGCGCLRSYGLPRHLSPTNRWSQTHSQFASCASPFGRFHPSSSTCWRTPRLGHTSWPPASPWLSWWWGPLFLVRS